MAGYFVGPRMEKRVIVEDCEEEEDDNFPGFAEYGAFSDTTMWRAKDEAAEGKRTNDLDQLLTCCVMLIKTTKVKMNQRNSSAC